MWICAGMGCDVQMSSRLRFQAGLMGRETSVLGEVLQCPFVSSQDLIMPFYDLSHCIGTADGRTSEAKGKVVIGDRMQAMIEKRSLAKALTIK